MSLEREQSMCSKKMNIIMHKTQLQGRHAEKPNIEFKGQTFKYTEDTGCVFDSVYYEPEDNSRKRTLHVSCICNGHGGHMASYLVVDAIPELFPECLDITSGNITDALYLLFSKLTSYINSIGNELLNNSGTSCNIMVFDIDNEKVYIANLGNSSCIRYRRAENGDYKLIWKIAEQNCGDELEINRMVEIHKENGFLDSKASDVIYEVLLNNKGTGVWKNKISDAITHSALGYLQNNYYPNMVNTIPRVESQEWTVNQINDIWIQSTSGLMDRLNHMNSGIQPSQSFRLEEIASHLKICYFNYNVASSLHDMQMDSILKQKLLFYPLRNDSSQSWVKSNIDNCLTNVFML
jgi:hypothetical protein